MDERGKLLQLPDGQEDEGLGIFVYRILRHWEQAFPRRYKALRRAGTLTLRAREAARRAAFVLEQCAAANLDWGVSQELAAEEWGRPPEA